MHFTPEQRAKIAKHAAECGNVATVRHFKNEFSNLGESTVRLFKEAIYCRTPEKGTCTRDYLPAKEKARKTTYSCLVG